MLHLQKASAGSGKTFTLAKTYIRLLISIREPGAPRRLRSNPEIRDAASHILAVTFTNKATNEMKLRIVGALAAIASWSGSGRKPDYLEDLEREFDAGSATICQACDVALRSLLFQFSDFNVSTIDSFFQSVLRTFAYETELSDNYRLEIDTDYLSSLGLDRTLDDAIARRGNRAAQYWIARIMSDSRSSGNRSWNIFQRNSAKDSPYMGLVKVAKRLANEDYKRVRFMLNKYFERHGEGLPALYERLDSELFSPVYEAFEEVRARALDLSTSFCLHGLDATTDIRDRKGSLIRNLLDPKTDALQLKPSRLDEISDSKSPLKTDVQKRIGKSTPIHDIRESYQALASALGHWADLRASRRLNLWCIYRRNLPNLGLIHSIDSNIRNFLEESNTMQLADTNTLIARIIGDDERADPFIYERLGTRLNHFLIDEFQDTSLMQWRNFRPLLAESESYDHDNLVIGDAKQSIYRFRNADPSIIRLRVPEAFPDHDDSPDPPLLRDPATANTNWRSKRNIVEFNNFLFRNLAPGISPEIGELYEQTVQRPAHTEPEGYVELHIFDSKQPLGYSDQNETDEDADPPGDSQFRRLGPMISRLRDRGYRLRDIAVLVTTNDDGALAVSSLADYNMEHPSDTIDFISDQSLRLASSRSVNIILTALRMISEGVDNPLPKEMAAADSDALSRALAGSVNGEELSEMLSEMQSVALPSLVEAIIERFVKRGAAEGDPDSLITREAPFIATFQDCVLDFCERGEADPASFLDWWSRKGKNLSVVSPDSGDAVTVLTIHKSKGLEYKVVIMPRADMNFNTRMKAGEWEWVAPDPEFDPEGELPPVIPVDVTRDLLEIEPLAPIVANRNYLRLMDSINLAYVGFTRAVDELYVFAPYTTFKGKMQDTAVGARILTLAENSAEVLKTNEEEIPDERRYMPAVALQITAGENGEYLVTSGEPMESARIAEERERSERKLAGAPPNTPIAEYQVWSGRGQLRYRDTESRLSEDPEEADPRNPRAEGSLLHEAMSQTFTDKDLTRAVRKLRIRGLINRRRQEQIETELRGALESVRPYGWFQPEAGTRIFTERPLLRRGESIQRPDRMMLLPDGRCVIIDYKFGRHTSARMRAGYESQVRRYMRAARGAGCRQVTGYLWYVRSGRVEEISSEAPDGK